MLISFDAIDKYPALSVWYKTNGKGVQKFLPINNSDLKHHGFKLLTVLYLALILTYRVFKELIIIWTVPVQIISYIKEIVDRVTSH